MPETIKVLGQADPSAATLTTLYTVPGITSVVTSTIVVANRTAANREIRVSVAVGGEPDDPKQYIYYDVRVLKNDSIFATIGMTLAAADEVRVYSNLGGVSFTLFGTEITR